MSGVVKGVKKVFKKVAKVLKKIIVPVAIAVAAYFTAGVALSFIPATSAFAASLPGFAGGGLLGTGIGAGATAGTGIFSTAASAIGLGGKLAAHVVGTGAAATAGAGGAIAAGAAGIPTIASVPLGDTLGVIGSMAGGGGAAVAPLVAPTVAPLVAPAAAMSITDKLLLAKVGTDVAGALFGPTIEDDWEEQAAAAGKFRGAFYGMEADGTGAIEPTVPQPQQQAPVDPQQGQLGQVPNAQPQPQPQPQALPAPGTVTPTAAQPGSQPGSSLFPDEEQVAVAQPTGNLGQMQTQINAPSSLFAPTPGVRYV